MLGPFVRNGKSIGLCVLAVCLGAYAAAQVSGDSPPATRPAAPAATQAAGGDRVVTADTVFRQIDGKDVRFDTLDKGAPVTVLKPGREFCRVRTSDGREGEVPTRRLDPPIDPGPPPAPAAWMGPGVDAGPPAPVTRPAVRQPTRDETDRAIQKAKDYLYSRQKDGNLELPAPPQAPGAA